MKHKVKWWIFYFTMSVLLFGSCESHQQLANSANIDSLIVGKWKMVKYAGGYVNAPDTLSFCKNGKADCPPETGEFTCCLIKPDSLVIIIVALENSISRFSNYPMTAL